MSISRNTAIGVPKYDDNNENLSDKYILNNSDRLIHISENKYRPSIDTNFWTITQENDFWTITTKDGTLYIIGHTINSKLFDESNSGNVFAWYLEKIVDPNGNEIRYTYKKDSNKLYLDKIKYGPYEVTFDYEQRRDEYSDYRAGFPIHTIFRCKKITFTSELSEQYMKSYRLEYENTEPRLMSLLKKVTLRGGNTNTGTGNTMDAPSISIKYTDLDIENYDDVLLTDNPNESLPNLSSNNSGLLDITGDGFPDFIDFSPFGTRFWQNNGKYTFDVPKSLNTPDTVHNANNDFVIADMEGNGTADLLVFSNRLLGYFPNTTGTEWTNFQSYENNQPPFNPADENFRLMDIDGDGKLDAVFTDTEQFFLYTNLGKSGWKESVDIINRRHNLSVWPDIFFSNQSVMIGDMNGDNLPDIVDLRSGQISYWPYMGYGKWDKRVIIENSPSFPSNFEEEKLFLMDVDRDGTADLVYVDLSKIIIWINRSGKSFSDPIEISPIPPSNYTNVIAVDIAGNGNTGLLFSYENTITGAVKYRFFSLRNTVPPYLLDTIDDDLGSITNIQYKLSTFFKLKDNTENKKWKTFLPFPLQVVSSVIQYDKVTKITSSTDYIYHEGHYDGEHKEFRGFHEVEEIKKGDSTTPTVIKRYIHNLGIDVSIDESDRRANSDLISKQKARSLKGTLEKVESFSIPSDRDEYFEVDKKEEIINKWDSRIEIQNDIDLVIFPFLSATIFNKYNSGHIFSTNTIISKEYDKYGNLLVKETESKAWDNNIPFIEHYIIEEFKYATTNEDSESWIVGKLCRIVQKDKDGNIISVKKILFDGGPFSGLPFGSITKGNITAVEELVYREDDQIFNTFSVDDPTTLGYHLVHDQENSSYSGWYRYQIRYENNLNGTISKIVDSLGNILSINYDQLEINPIKVIDAEGLITTAGYNYDLNIPESVTRPSGNQEFHKFDVLGRIKEIYKTHDDLSLQLSSYFKYENGDFLEHSVIPQSITTIQCKEIGRNPGEFDNTVQLQDLTNVKIEKVFYSGKGVKIQTIVNSEPDSDESYRTIVSSYKNYNVNGRVIFDGYPSYERTFNYKTFDEIPSFGHKFKYDYNNIVYETIRPDNKIYTTEFQGNRVIYTNEKDNENHQKFTKIEYYDSLNRLVKLEECKSNTESYFTNYRYDLNSNLIEVLDNRGFLLITYKYDKLNRKINIKHSDAGEKYFLYDAASNLVRSINARGEKIRNEYDKINRLIKTYHIVDSNGSENLIRTYIYDHDPDRPNEYFLRGRLAIVDDENATTKLSYNASGQVILKKRIIKNSLTELKLKSAYSFDGRLNEIFYPDESSIKYEYYESGLLKSVPGIINNIEYNIMTLPIKLSYSNGITNTFHYDSLFNLKESIIKSNMTDLAIFKYDYDTIGNLTLFNEKINGEILEKYYTYDSLNRLINIYDNTDNSNPSSTFNYDSFGNLIENTDSCDGMLDYSINKPNQLIKYKLKDTSSISNVFYDHDGNITSNGIQNFSYDIFGRLTNVIQVNEQMETEILYDYKDQIIFKRINKNNLLENKIEYFDNLYEVHDNMKKNIISSPLGILAEIINEGDGHKKIFYHHKDHMGSTRIKTDENGNVIYKMKFSAFGLPLDSNVNQNDYFTEKKYNYDIGLYKLGSRFYDPRIGRFLSPDITIIGDCERVISNPQYLNPYSYSLNNPLTYIDPNGNEPFLITAAIIGAIIGAVLANNAAREQGVKNDSELAFWTVAGAIVGALAGGFGIIGATPVYWEGANYVFTEYVTDKPYSSSNAIVSFGVGVVSGYLWKSYLPATDKPYFDYTWEEIVKTGIKNGIDAGMTEVIMRYGDDYLKQVKRGFEHGGEFSLSFGSLQGVLYDPFKEIEFSDIDKQYKKDNLSPKMDNITKDRPLSDIRNVEFRKGGVFNLSKDGTEIGINSISLSPNDYTQNVKLLAQGLRGIAA